MASTIKEQMVITTEATEEKPLIAYDEKAPTWSLLDHLLWSFASISPAYLFVTPFPSERPRQTCVRKAGRRQRKNLPG